MNVPQRVHDLKCWPESFEAVLAGLKTVELRLNDRDYQAGDRLILREYDPEKVGLSVEDSRDMISKHHKPRPFSKKGQFTGRACAVDVTHVLTGGEFGLDRDYVALSVRLV